MTENGAGTKKKTRIRTRIEIADGQDLGTGTGGRDQSQERGSVADHVTETAKGVAVL